MLIARPVLFTLITLCICSTTALAQEATPAGGFDPAARFQAHILAGDCTAPAETAFALADAGYGLPVTAAAVTAAYRGPVSANPAMVSVSTVDTPLDQLVERGHAIDIHSAAEGDDMETRIACGVIGGFRAGDDLVFGLEEANASRYGGVAWLHDNGDDSTTVTLFLVSGLAHQEGTPVASNVVAPAEPVGGLPPEFEVVGIVVDDGEFAAEGLTLTEDVPTVAHVINSDDQDYQFRLGDLVAPMRLPANQLTVVEFTTPSAGTYEAQLLDADGKGVLDSYPVYIVPAESGH